MSSFGADHDLHALRISPHDSPYLTSGIHSMLSPGTSSDHQRWCAYSCRLSLPGPPKSRNRGRLSRDNLPTIRKQWCWVRYGFTGSAFFFFRAMGRRLILLKYPVFVLVLAGGSGSKWLFRKSRFTLVLILRLSKQVGGGRGSCSDSSENHHGSGWELDTIGPASLASWLLPAYTLLFSGFGPARQWNVFRRWKALHRPFKGMRETSALFQLSGDQWDRAVFAAYRQASLAFH